MAPPYDQIRVRILFDRIAVDYFVQMMDEFGALLFWVLEKNKEKGKANQ